MRRAAALALVLFALPLVAAEAINVAVRQSATLQIMGASAAWSVDGTIADASAQSGVVTIFGRTAGRTKIVVVSITGTSELEVVVSAPRSARTVQQEQPTARARTTAEARYSSAARELQNSVTVRGEKTEAGVRVVHYNGAPQGVRAQTSIAGAYYRLFDRGRELTLLDSDVDYSPLTLRNTPVRGIHYRDEHWRLHAGYTAYATYASFLIPIERQLVAGGGYAFRLSEKSRLTPGVFAYPGQGTVVSLLHDYRDGERLSLTTELAFSRGLGAATELSYVSGADRVRADIRYRGDDFAVAGSGSPRGFFGDASWTHEYGRGSTASLVAAATDTAGSRVLGASADLDHRVTDVLSLTGGASWGSFDGARALTVPAGVRLDFAHGGITALYRYSQSPTNSGGNGFRIAARASVGRVYMSAFADRQENAPTLAVIFAERPDLALALGELGITATTPADIARALRDNAALINLGFIDGVTVDLAPLRTQYGFELSILGTSASRQQLRARLLRNRTETVSNSTETTIATLSYSRRITQSTDVFGSYSYWRTARQGQAANVQPIVEAGVRHRFDGAPTLIRNGRISGRVFADEDLDGRADAIQWSAAAPGGASGAAVAAVIELDGTRRETTAPDGTFTFSGISAGPHRLVVSLPDQPHAYFTTPSRVEANTGETVSFGVATMPARLNGRVVDDSGDGVRGVRVMLGRGATQSFETTVDGGRFAFAAAPGEWQLQTLGDSLPAGYSITGTDPRAVSLDRNQPTEVQLTLRAHRTINGSGAPPHAEIDVRPTGKRVQADESGNFVVRSLPAGEITLAAGGVERRVTLGKPPSITEVRLSAAPPVERGEWRVAIGAYRNLDNARQALQLARAQGVSATLSASGSLTIVTAGPFVSRAAASAVADRLTRASLEGIVTRMK